VPAPLSVDLRARIIAAWQRQDSTWDELADVFDVGVASVNRLIRRFRATGSIEPEPHAGGQWHRIPDEKLPVLRALVVETPDATLEELTTAYMARTGDVVGRSTLDRALGRLDITRKKRPSSRASAIAKASPKSAVPSSRRSKPSRPSTSSSSTNRARTSR